MGREEDFLEEVIRKAERQAVISLKRMEDLRGKDLSKWGYKELGYNEAIYYNSLDIIDILNQLQRMKEDNY